MAGMTRAAGCGVRVAVAVEAGVWVAEGSRVEVELGAGLALEVGEGVRKGAAVAVGLGWVGADVGEPAQPLSSSKAMMRGRIFFMSLL